jgi:hypothetical protein
MYTSFFAVHAKFFENGNNKFVSSDCATELNRSTVFSIFLFYTERLRCVYFHIVLLTIKLNCFFFFFSNAENYIFSSSRYCPKTTLKFIYCIKNHKES